MHTSEHDRFWQLYDTRARPAIERACRSLSRTLTDNRMDPDDMIAWASQRVWKLLEKGGWPTFHDDPTPEQAATRLADNAHTIARWAYLALSRRHWRREANQRAYEAGLSRAEKLAMVSASEPRADRERVEADLARVRASVEHSVRQRLAASWPDPSERRRIAMALGTQRPEDDRVIQDVLDGRVKPNTVQQMRSRSLRRVRAIFADSRRVSALLLAAASLILASATTTRADEGERTGGREGAAVRAAPSQVASEGERTGGRRGSGSTIAPDTAPDPLSLEGERTGGRKGS